MGSNQMSEFTQHVRRAALLRDGAGLTDRLIETRDGHAHQIAPGTRADGSTAKRTSALRTVS